MAIAKIDCNVVSDDDGTFSLVVTARGLNEAEAVALGSASEEPLKAMLIAATKGRHTPDTIIRNMDTGEERDLKPETLQ